MTKKPVTSGTILHIDLTTKKAWAEDLPSPFQKLPLRGKALGLKLLSSGNEPDDSPLSPSNKIVLSTGLLTGTGAPTGAWLTLLARSPLTGMLSASSWGGNFPVSLKRTGYDAVVIEGKAKEPTSIVIGDDIQFLETAFLWGKTTERTNEYFLSRWGKVDVLCIGPSGERQHKTATPVMDRYRNGISPGLGALMGSKNLKALVARGNRPLSIADPEAMRDVSSKILEKISRKFVLFRQISSDGTAHFLHALNEGKALPTRNFRSGEFDELEKVDGRAVYHSILSKRIACFSCPIGCRRLSRLGKPPAQKLAEGPDLLDIISFGTLCGNSDLQTILESRHRCNDLGLDPLSIGATISLLMDLQEENRISEREVGFPIRFGNVAAILKIIDQIEQNEGIGKILAEDPSQVASDSSLISPRFHVRQQPVGPGHPVWDPYSDLHYKTSNSGARYTLGAGPFAGEIGIYNQFDAKGEVSRVILFQDTMAVLESLGLCEYLLLFLDLNDIASLIAPVLGSEADPRALLRWGGKISGLERRLNLGWEKDPLQMDASPDWSSQTKDDAVSQYFSLRDWDSKGTPKGNIEL
jgi:aldehyde:ferredoxin oxidoreductase